MADSKGIAGLLGPALIVLGASEVTTADIWTTVTAPQVYLAGALWFVAGLSIVRVHNRWLRSWPVLITVMGWFLIFGGISRMFAPGLANQGAQNAPALSLVAGQLVLVAIGVFLSVKAYWPQSGSGRPRTAEPRAVK